MEQELTPTETSQEVKRTVLEADLPQSAVSEWGSGNKQGPRGPTGNWVINS
uniref:Uncharacterized protein n=1 Tax=Anguilla anguilla TaxID=7936 RepID=A0A0E9SFN1_ANGAN